MIENLVELIRTIYAKEDTIPLHRPKFVGSEKELVLDTINSTFVSSVGSYVNQVEAKISEICDVKNTVAVINGTAALQVALEIVGVRKGDEVITQSLTFVATSNAVLYNNASPVFIDVDLDNMGMSPEALERFFCNETEKKGQERFNKSTGKRIAACIPVHTFGFVCRIDEIVTICNKYGVPVIEDSAEALGSFYKGKSAGNFGDIGIFSFNGNKIITAGGGGALVTNSDKFAAKAKHITATAKLPHKWEYVHDQMGYNYRMPNLNAALLLGQIAQLDNFITEKRKILERYKMFFEKTDYNVVNIPLNVEWNYWLVSINIGSLLARDKFLKILNENKIMARPIWKLNHELPMYSSCYADSMKNSKYLSERIINLPSSVI